MGHCSMGKTSSLQVHALHPLYLSLHALSDDMPEDLQQQIDSAAKALTAADVDYDATMAAKILIARSLFDRSGAALLQVRPATFTDAML